MAWKKWKWCPESHHPYLKGSNNYEFQFVYSTCFAGITPEYPTHPTVSGLGLGLRLGLGFRIRVKDQGQGLELGIRVREQGQCYGQGSAQGIRKLFPMENNVLNSFCILHVFVSASFVNVNYLVNNSLLLYCNFISENCISSVDPLLSLLRSPTRSSIFTYLTV